MATEKNIIRINPTQSSTLEFDVMISGLDTTDPIVKFVIQNANDGIDWVVKCSKLEGSKWQASFPVFKDFTKISCPFCVEVVVDEYFFKPAEGTIEFVNVSNVSFDSKTSKKPSVTTSFVVKQDNASTKKESKKKVTESIKSRTLIPPGNVLVPEETPLKPNAKIPHTQKDDESINKARLEQITDEDPVPGSGIQYPQDDYKEDDESLENDFDDTMDDIRERIAPTGEFDPKKMAEAIIQTSINMKKFDSSSLRGSLFKRDNEGKPIVPGLETNKQLQEKMVRDQKVKDLLKQ